MIHPALAPAQGDEEVHRTWDHYAVAGLAYAVGLADERQSYVGDLLGVVVQPYKEGHVGDRGDRVCENQVYGEDQSQAH